LATDQGVRGATHRPRHNARPVGRRSSPGASARGCDQSVSRRPPRGKARRSTPLRRLSTPCGQRLSSACVCPPLESACPWLPWVGLCWSMLRQRARTAPRFVRRNSEGRELTPGQGVRFTAVRITPFTDDWLIVGRRSRSKLPWSQFPEVGRRRLRPSGRIKVVRTCRRHLLREGVSVRLPSAASLRSHDGHLQPW